MGNLNNLLPVPGGQLYYEKGGQGTTLVFLHGFSLDTRMWDEQFEFFGQQYQVIRYDLRGFGRSSLPDAPYSHVDDLDSLLNHLQIQQAHLIGLSKGGAIALDYALIHPKRVASLVLIDTVLGGFNWSPESSAQDGRAWQVGRQKGIPAAKQAWLEHPYFRPAMQQPLVAARLKQIIAEYTGWHFVNHNPERGITPPAFERLGELCMPVLSLVGEYDLPDFHRIASQIVEQAPSAQSKTITGVGHMANMEAPAYINQSIQEFYGAL